MPGATELDRNNHSRQARSHATHGVVSLSLKRSENLSSESYAWPIWSKTKRRAADEERAWRAEAALGIGSIKHVFDFAVEAQTEPVVDRQRVPRDQVGLHVSAEDVERVEGRGRERR